MNNKDFIQTINKQLSLVTEAIRPQDFKKSADLILQYF